MTKISDRQSTLFDLTEYEGVDSGMWGWLESETTQGLGTKNKNLVPNSSPPTTERLGTKNKNLVPNSEPPTTEQLGTKHKKLVPNSEPPTTEQLGTKHKKLVPNSEPNQELGTNNSLVPNPEIWKPPIGCLNQKWQKANQYWYWSYYKSKGKKTSLYLAKDYNEAISKAKKIGIPSNAKPPKIRASASEN